MVILNFLKGKKTYIVAVLMIALGILQRNTELIMEGLAIMFLRAGIDKVGGVNK